MAELKTFRKTGKYRIEEYDSLDEQLELLKTAISIKNTEDTTLFALPGGDLGYVRQRDGEWTYQPYNEDALNAHLCKWVVPIGDTKKDSFQPKPKLSAALVKAYVGSGDWPGVPTIRRMAKAPVVGADLDVVWHGGYAPSAQTFVTEGMWTPDGIEAGVTPEKARSAAAYLLGWFDSFALENRDSAADALGLALTPMLMGYIKDAPVPGGIFIATKEGSGKTTCAQMVSVLATGQPTAPTTWPSASQMKNTITTLVKGSAPVALFDNVKSDLDSDALESLLTSRKWSDRKFHSQEELRLPNDTLWLFTKNSPSLSPDMLRRLVIISLDKFNSETTWNPNVVRDAQASRQAIQEAMVSLIINWKQQGCPTGSVTFSGFEQWSETVSGILEASGVTGFGTTRTTALTEVYTEDDDTAEIVNRIFNIMGETVWTASDLWDSVNVDYLDRTGDELIKDKDAVSSWLKTGAKNGAMSAGKKISALVGKQLASTPFVIKRLTGKRAKYRIEIKQTVAPGNKWVQLMDQAGVA